MGYMSTMPSKDILPTWKMENLWTIGNMFLWPQCAEERDIKQARAASHINQMCVLMVQKTGKRLLYLFTKIIHIASEAASVKSRTQNRMFIL